MWRSHRASGSVCPPTPAVGDQPSSRQVMLRVALPPSSLFIQPPMSSYLFFLIQACFFPLIYLFLVLDFFFFFLHQGEHNSASPGSTFIRFLSPPLNIWSLTDCDACSVERAGFHSRKKMMRHDACIEAVRGGEERSLIWAATSNLLALILYFPQSNSFLFFPLLRALKPFCWNLPNGPIVYLTH